MEPAGRVFHDLVEKFLSWIGYRAERSNMSRDFWMPDESCRVCYECESPFNLFNRRHHCRICGQIFCGKCTQNTLPTVDRRARLHEEGERVRVCNFCFKLSQEDGQNEAKSSTPMLTPSSSSFSLASSSTSGSSSSSSSGNSGQLPAGYSFRPPTVSRIELSAEKKQRIMTRSGRRALRSLSPSGRDLSPNPYDFCSNRSDDDDGDSKVSHHDSSLFEARSPKEPADQSQVEMELPDLALKCSSDNFTQESLDYVQKPQDTIDDNRDGEDIHSRKQSGTMVERTLSKRSTMSSDDYEGPDESVDESKIFAPSVVQDSTYGTREEPVDVENNPEIWIPPSPEDEDDDIEMSLVDEDDDDEDPGWGSVSSSEYRSRDKAATSHEQRNAMRAVVDGHFRALVEQLLDGEGMRAEEDEDSWLKIVTDLALQAASLVKPDMSTDGGMDPGGYVKVKCIAAGMRRESRVVKGVVCKRNVAHRRMTSQYKNPRLLLLGGALEYQRVSNQLSSLDTLLQQEKDHLSMTVAKIEAHHPNVVLVEKTVSRQAQEKFLSKDISLVLNVKRPLLERIARCTGAEIVPAPDHHFNLKSGHCEQFHVEKYMEELGSAGQGGKKLPKTLMFFEGCPRPLGCTVLLKGAHGDELKRIKRVVQYAVFAAYQLALETSFLVDERATLPELSFKSPISVALPDKQLKSDRAISTVPGFLLPAPGSTTGESQTPPVRPEPSAASFVACLPPIMSIPSWGDGSVKISGANVLAPSSVASSCVSSRTNSPSTSPRAVNAQEASLRGFGNKSSNTNNLNMSLPEMVNLPTRSVPSANVSGSGVSAISGLSMSLKRAPSGVISYSSAPGDSSLKLTRDKAYIMDSKPLGRHISGTGSPRFSPMSNIPGFSEANGQDNVTRLVKMDSDISIGQNGQDNVTRLVKMDSDISIGQNSQLSALSELQNGLLWEEQDGNQEDFPPSPSDHQSILVSFSSSCLNKGTVCERGHLLRIKYYGSFDKPLGKFLRVDVFDVNHPCKYCDEKRDAHIHCYTHQQGSLTISVRQQNNALTGERDGKIWMWHRCLKCNRINNIPPPTRRVVMSDAAWGLSFGKFLELSFSNHAAASRLASCGHSLHRDCLRFYGFGSMVACFRYAPINVHSVFLPPSKLEFNNPALYDWLANEVSEVTSKGNLFFADTLNRLRSIEEKVASYGSGKTLEARRHLAEYENLLQNDMAAFKELLQKAAPMEREPGRMFADILQLNSMRRSLAGRSIEWNKRFDYLISFLKLGRPNPMSVSANLDDPSIVLRNKDASFVDKSGPLDGEDSCSNTLSGISECSKPTQIQSCDISSQVGFSPVDEAVQPNEQITRHIIDNSNDSLLNQNEDNAKSCNDTPCNQPQQDIAKGRQDETSIDCNTSENECLLIQNKLGQDKDSVGLTVLSESNPLSNAKEKECNFELAEDTASICANLSKDDLFVRRALSEGQFPILPDLSDTFEAAWTGKGQTIEAHAVNISLNGQEIVSRSGKLDAACGESSSLSNAGFVSSSDVTADCSLKSGLRNSSSVYEVGGSADGPMTSSPSSPAKNVDLPDDVGTWMGTPFSSLHRLYSRGSENFQAGPSAMWADGDARLFLPVGVDNTVIPVYDDEPTSIIAYAIMSRQYQARLSDRPSEKDKLKERDKEKEQKREKEKEKSLEFIAGETVVSHPLQFAEHPSEQSDLASKDKSSNLDEILPPTSKEGMPNDSLLYSKAMHVKVSFTPDAGDLGKVKYMVTCYYAKQFDGLRKKCCPDQMEFIRSLCRCKKWGAQGGKSNVFFAKTADDRFVIKQVTKTELESFIKFAPDYFKYLSDALTSGSPTCLAKILGIFQVTIKHGKGGREVRMDLMAMENLLYGRHVTRLYDLKGSLRSRYNADATGKNKVLLDQNLLEAMLTNPIFVGNKAKRILERAVWNDTAFLASVDVMDYSLLVGVDEERQELVLGIIDFMRQYTWDKHLETWVKASGILGGPKNAAPTVVSPKQYKKRFRKAMKTYFLMVPDQWSTSTETFGPSVDSASVESYPSTFQDEASEDNFNVKI